MYFNALFGKSFTRSTENNINAALNYGYSILLSAFNREIVSAGYLTQVGLFHSNMYNNFNLSCDLMEPFRIIVDEKVWRMKIEKFEREEKLELVNLLNVQVKIEGRQQFLLNAIKVYVKSVFDVLNQEENSQLKFYENEL